MTLFAEVAVWQPLLGSIVIGLAVWAVWRELEVRLVLFTAALALGAIALNPQAIVREFLATFTNEKFIIPLCCGMGFARVLTHTGCDQHLVHLLVRPLTYVRFLLIPGTVIVGFLVNMPIVSQTSTAVTIGFVVIPLLRAARLSPVTIGSALLLGCSIGGELLNPGAPELLTTITESQKAAKRLPELGHDPSAYDSARCVRRIAPLNFIGLTAATLVFWWLASRYERRLPPSDNETDASPAEEAFQVNWFKAAVPLVPLVFLYLCSYPFELLHLDAAWLESGEPTGRYQTRLIGFAMLLGVVVAALTAPSKLKDTASVFCEGAGYGFAHIVSLIVAATCFGTAVKEIGIAAIIGRIVQTWPGLLIPGAGFLSLGFAALCGSGMATAQSLFGFFAEPALRVNMDPTHVGAVVSLAAAAGRTMSPVSAVCVMCARMTGTKPLELSKQVVLPLLISVAIIVIVAMIIVPTL
ncbi:MAG: C4-dicarboxylate transporter DcuC [Planctomycetes bacterium]|nr:C4-dicarboxylate transporter DcuC [Planctomycetota bacterium]